MHFEEQDTIVPRSTLNLVSTNIMSCTQLSKMYNNLSASWLHGKIRVTMRVRALYYDNTVLGQPCIVKTLYWDNTVLRQHCIGTTLYWDNTVLRQPLALTLTLTNFLSHALTLTLTYTLTYIVIKLCRNIVRI